MPFHQHTLAQRPAPSSARPARRRGRSPSASSSAPGRATRRRRSPASRTSSSTWSSRARRGAPPSTSTATSTASAPTTTPSPARRTPSSTPPSCRSTCRRRSTSSPTSCGPACATTTSTWRRRSSSKRSACTTTSRCGRPTTTPSRRYFADHPLGNSILGTPESITALTRDQMHGLLRPPLRRAEHHGRRRPATSTGRRLVAAGREALRPAGSTGRSAAQQRPRGARRRRVPGGRARTR